MQQPRHDHPSDAGIAPPYPTPSPTPGCLAEALIAATEADWSLAELGRWLHRLGDWAGELAAPERLAWQAGLRTLLEHHGWAMSSDAHRQLLDVGWRWDDWPLVVAVGERLAEDAGHDPALIRALACAHWHLGDPARALALLYSVVVSRPDDQAAFALYCDIEQWWLWRESYPLVGEPAADDGELRLEPMGEHHFRDFAWQYHDPAIAALCCLPGFTNDRAWVDWLRDTHGLGDQLVFAVLHAQWGFIGSVSLILHRGVGFFYYWVGPEYQGNGLGPRAVTMMLRAARHAYGMHACYAKAFVDNYPSRRGLGKLGFEPMAVRPAAPHEGELFYRLGNAVTDAAAVGELRMLLADMGSEVRLPEPGIAR